MTRTRSRESGLKGPLGRQVAAGPRNYRHCGGMQGISVDSVPDHEKWSKDIEGRVGPPPTTRPFARCSSSDRIRRSRRC